MLILTIVLALLDLAFVALNIHLVKTLLAKREQRLLLKLRKYRSTKLGRLYRKAVGSRKVIVFPVRKELLAA